MLTDTASRSLAARMRGDRRALEREQAYQSSAIAAGVLDPTAPPLRQSAAAPQPRGTATTTPSGSLHRSNPGPPSIS